MGPLLFLCNRLEREREMGRLGSPEWAFVCSCVTDERERERGRERG